jgi:hypothetical protein
MTKETNPYLMPAEDVLRVMRKAGIIDDQNHLLWPFANEEEPEMSTKPFDLEAAIAGAPMITDTGLDMTFLYYDVANSRIWVLAHSYADEPWAFNAEGNGISRAVSLLMKVAEEEPSEIEQRVRESVGKANEQIKRLFSRVAMEGSPALTAAVKSANEVLTKTVKGFVDSYDEWFKAKVQASIKDPRPSMPHAEVMRQMDDIINSPVVSLGETWLADLSDYEYGNDYKEVTIVDKAPCEVGMPYPLKVQYDTRPALWIDSADLRHKLKDSE